LPLTRIVFCVLIRVFISYHCHIKK